MERKVKYDLAFKLKCVKSVLETQEAISCVSNREGIQSSQLRLWIDLFKDKGISGLIPRKNQSYTSTFKLKVLKTKELERLSLREVRLRFNIPSDSIVVKWEQDFATFGMDGLIPKPLGRPPTMSNYKRKQHKSDKPLTREEELLLENERLRAENDFLKKFNALVQGEEKKLAKRNRKL